jgi:D-alanyl-D-alanine carboxypeptidase (penicillin-binding protein 5/6)
MTKSFKYFLIGLILSFPFWFGVNLLEKNLKDFFYWQELANHPEIFYAQTAPKRPENPKPVRNNEAGDLNLEAKSAISLLIDKIGRKRVLFGKDGNQQLPIASLTKLMTALVVLENYDATTTITISKEAVAQPEDFGKLKAGEVLTVEYLLYPLLMESSNDAAFSLANDYPGMTEKMFAGLMNDEAKKIGLQNTVFFNSTGLDSDQSKTEMNLSTAADLAILAEKTLEKPLIWKILSTPKYQVYGPELINTNELLEDSVSWHDEIIGGKTGYTDTAGGCMILVLKAPEDPGSLLINVILGADGTNSRFEQMKKLVNWLDTAYAW